MHERCLPHAGSYRAACDGRQCAWIPCAVKALGDRVGLRVSPGVVSTFRWRLPCGPEVCPEGGSRIGRFGGVLVELAADVVPFYPSRSGVPFAGRRQLSPKSAGRVFDESPGG